MNIPRPSSSLAGLSVLLGNSDSAQARLMHIPVEQIVRNEAQPRTHFDPDAIAALAESISAQGMIQPIAVRQLTPDTFEIVAGERRWLASQRAGLRTVAAVVHEIDERESLVLALAENLVRENLNPLETARAYAALLDEFSMSVAELARAVGKSRPAVANTLRLLELPDTVLALIEERRLSEGHGRALLQVTDRLTQQRLAHQAVEQSMSVRALEFATRSATEADSPVALQNGTRAKHEVSPELEARVERLAEQLTGVHVRLKPSEAGGKLELRCTSTAALNELLGHLESALTRSA